MIVKGIIKTIFIFVFIVLYILIVSTLIKSYRVYGIYLLIICAMLYQIRNAEERAVKEYNKKVGIAGWLYFIIGLLFTIGIFSALLNISNIIFPILLYPVEINLILKIFGALLGFAMIYAAYLMWNLKPKSDGIALLVIFINYFALFSYLLMDSWSVLLIFAVIANTAIGTYLITSERVENTYGKKHIRSIAFESNKIIKKWIIFQFVIASVVFIAYLLEL